MLRVELRLIVVGASAGGVGALTSPVRDLPGDLGFAALVVLHVGAESILPDCSMGRPLPARHAERGRSTEPGRVYKAPPGTTLAIGDAEGALQLYCMPCKSGARVCSQSAGGSAEGPRQPAPDAGALPTTLLPRPRRLWNGLTAP